MISRKAVRQFLDRKLRNLSLLKDLSDKELDESVAALIGKSKQYTAMRRCQKEAFVAAVRIGNLYCMFDMGLGKTKLSLDLARYYKSKTLVLVPNTIAIETWRMQALEHSPDLSVACVQGTTQERKQNLVEDVDVLVMTYAAMLSVVCSLQRSKKGKRQLTIDNDKVSAFVGRFGFAVYDEVTALMNHRS